MGLYKVTRGSGGRVHIGQVQPPERRPLHAKDEFADLDRALEAELAASDKAVRRPVDATVAPEPEDDLVAMRQAKAEDDAAKGSVAPGDLPPPPPLHAGAAGIPCDFCDFVAGSLGGLLAHVEAQHPGEVGEPAEAPVVPETPAEAAPVPETPTQEVPEETPAGEPVEEPAGDEGEVDPNAELMAELDAADDEVSE